MTHTGAFFFVPTAFGGLRSYLMDRAKGNVRGTTPIVPVKFELVI